MLPNFCERATGQVLVATADSDLSWTIIGHADALKTVVDNHSIADSKEYDKIL